MFLGRKEYGEKHRKYVIIAGIIFLISIIFAVLLVVGLVISMFSMASEIQFEQTVDLSFFSYFFLIIPIGAFLNSLFMFFLLYNLEDDIGKKFLISGIIIAMVVTIFLSFVTFQIANDWIIYAEDSINEMIKDPPHFSFTAESEIQDIFNRFTSDISSINLIGIIPNVFYLIAIYIPYKRIKSGELKPKTDSKNLYSKYCNNCGRPVPADSIVCAYCGKKFD